MITVAAAALLSVLSATAPGAVVVPAPATAAPGAGPGWTAEPAAGGRPYVYLEGSPGTVMEDRLSVTNRGAEPLTVRLRGAGADNAKNGEFAVRTSRTGTGTWIVLASQQVTVPPRTRADVPFAVTVPASATPGDHPAAIVATAGGREVGVRVHVRVAGPTLAALTVEDVRVEGKRIHYALVNRGNTVLAPRLALRADGLTGELLARPARPLPLELLPGRRVELTEPWPDPPALDSVDITLRVTASGGAHGEATASAVYVPWAAATGTALALAAAAAGAAALRLKRTERRPAKVRAQP
ncbi:COG1470 family protein [Streptomyces sp. NPDC001514]